MTWQQPILESRIESLEAQSRGYWLLMLAFSILSWCWLPSERKRLITRLRLRPGDRVLDHCIGTGDNLKPILSNIGPTGELHGFDLSPTMIRKVRRRAAQLGTEVRLLQGDAFQLPYGDESFDAVIHYGAINQFGDQIANTISEMIRVTRAGGIISIFDEGIEPTKRDRLWARFMIWRNDLFTSLPPLDQLPAEIKPRCEWVMNGRFWEISFSKPTADERARSGSENPVPRPDRERDPMS